MSVTSPIFSSRPVGIGVIVEVDTEPRGLAADPALGVLELADRLFSIVLDDRISLRIAVDRQAAGDLRCDVERIRTVANTGDPDCGMNAEYRWHIALPGSTRPLVRAVSP